MINKDLEFNEVELSKLNIHELRDLARDVGVVSPTTKSKGELTESILAIIYGEVPKVEVKSGAGRPVRAKTKPSKLLFRLDENDDDIELIDNPFVKKYEDYPEELFNETPMSDSEQVQEIYDYTIFNPYANTKVASPKKGYITDGSDVPSSDNEEMSPALLAMGRKIRKLLGREYDEDKNAEEEDIDDIDVKACIFVSGYVFEGPEDKFYVAYPETDEAEQVIYVIPDKIRKLFALKIGDFLEGWADPNIDAIVGITAVNGKFLFV